ncbi:MAG: gamma-glutamylcyclotransferase [Syntrophales bacterium]|nr:gamma-glutamylcyclotransferase [Syntrophales bacterium]
MECDLLYFAYGPNLNADDLNGWCRKRGYDYPLGEKVANAYLPDTRLIFNFYSESRQSGLLNIKYQAGHVTPGVLFKVLPAGLATLDARATAENMYQHLDVVTLTEDGREHVALAYQIGSTGVSKAFVKPSPAYVEVIRKGLKEHGITDSFLGPLAEGKSPPLTIDRLFLYGTFMSGGPRHALVTEWSDLSSRMEAVVPGLLYDSGKGFPCMIPDVTGKHQVRGDLYILKDFKKAFERMDFIEMTNKHRTTNLFFRRAIVRATGQDGMIFLAWSYLLDADSDVEGMPLIPSGDWRSVSE